MPNRISSSNAIRQPSFWKLLLHLPKLVRLVGRLMKDSRVPLAGKVLFVLSIVYFIVPIDLIPELFLPLIGQVDDVAILLFGLRYLLNQTPPNILEDHLAEIG
ncbi:MAG: DUF1232 domain-containing protein [candidate division KSB1 bacterium]|nr:DUF1232 domain-containing protein [candidate division KSB1 bacterium]MDZ7301002.1 DUF1232 domain-containing protein [candidate division KSB1 bacterium]MDZ7310319.1 DUF1232 domain-containing protein [candidate division KSB1 bacterium]